MFSEREKQIIKIIGRRKLTLSQIASELFIGSKIPLNWTICVGNSVSKIIKKCEYHETAWVLTKIRTDRQLYIKRSRVGWWYHEES